MSKLALLGGKRIRSQPFPAYANIGEAEKKAVNRVMDRGVLSKYLGAWGEDFYGGEEVQALEREFSDYAGIKYSVAVNSNSSGLLTALGACGVGYGDEVLVTPYSMSISASAPLVWNATPVFVDIDNNHFCISPAEIKRKITKNTKAIIIVHLFGCPADLDEIRKIAKENNIYVIEDCAQAPGATYKDKPVGTLGDIGVFSLNYHKHIHAGEGGVCVTNRERLATKMQLIRNHAEAVVEDKGETDLVNMIGFNFRLTELQAAIAREQLKKLRPEVELRQKYAKIYDAALGQFDFMGTTKIQDRTHAYYLQAFQYDAAKTAVPRERFLQAVRAELAPVKKREKEGVPVYGGYIKPLYMLPMFQKKLAYKNSFPFTGNENYGKGSCPIAEDMYYTKLWYHDFTRSPLGDSDIQDVVDAYTKVCENINEIK
ncbi:DegT/DnrJ/EryC1/StrS family aminotransferase [Candidatus Omnitrophota bacterium]